MEPEPGSTSTSGSAARHEPGRYRTFLLRVWREGSGEEATWRCSLEDPATRVRQGFEGVEGLASFLVRQYGNAGPDGDRSLAGRSGESP